MYRSEQQVNFKFSHNVMRFRFLCSVLTWLMLSVQCQYKKS